MISNTKEQPLISIIMPMYNQKDFIVQCLESVMKQTLSNIEIIVVNDGSTDQSPAMVGELAKQDSRIKIIEKKNSGYGNSVNIGMNHATGKYIGIVETDDFIATNMYEYLYDLSEEGTIDIVKGNFYDYYEKSGEKPRIVLNCERAAMPDIKLPFTIRQYPQLLWGHPSVWSAIYRREFLVDNNIKFLEVKGGGWVDNPFFFETLCKAKSIKWTKTPFYYYRKTNVNSSSVVVNPNLPFDRMNDNLDVLEKNHYLNDEILRNAYARALMYTTGALKECEYDKNFDLINVKAKQMLRRCDIDILKKYFNSKDIYTYLKFTSPIKTIMSNFPKILIYNWLPYDNPWNMGGGVTIYCKNLINTILKKYPCAQIYFLSSGFSYSNASIETYVRRIGSVYGERCKQYEIVNSPIPAPQDNLFVNPCVAIENNKLKQVVKDFIDDHGPFDVIHFNNIEGLSLDILDLKEDYPSTKFVYSLHNYVPICTTGFYYQRHKHCNCSTLHTDLDCIECTRINIKRNIANELYGRSGGKVTNNYIDQEKWIQAFQFDKLDQDVSPEHIQDFSKTAIAKINKYCDVILAVSKRVYDIAIDNGLSKDKMHVSYIGTAVANRQVGFSLTQSSNGLKIVFLGNSLHYEEKGYPFLLDTLEKLDEKYASKIDILLTVREDQHDEIYQKLKHFKSVKVVCGYSHKDLQWILDGCNLTIVPVLWEDNLPQIAIESVAYGVPVLASSFGGASELTSISLFKFEGGNSQDLNNKIMHFVDNPDDLNLYWSGHNGLMTMEAHWNELIRYYGLPEKQQDIVIDAEDFSYLLFENEFLHEHVDINCYETANINVETYSKLIRKIDKWFPKGSKRRKFFKRIFFRAK